MKIIILIIVCIVSNCSEKQKNANSQIIQINHPECCSTTVKTNPGDTLKISFTEYPGRAYTWMPQKTENSNKILFLFEKHTQLSTNDDTPETADYYFLCVKSGEITLTFRYVRPWEIHKAAANSCVVKVKILKKQHQK